MTKLSTKIIWMIWSIVFLSVAGSLALSAGWYWITIVFLLIFIYIIYKLYKLNIKAINQFSLFIESIKFADNSISFNNTLEDDIYINYYNNLNNSLKRLNTLIQKRESEISFYNNLLNRVDFALIVVDDKDEIVWINKMALDMFGRPKPNVLKDVSEDLIEVFGNLHPKKAKTIKIHLNGKMKNVVINLSTISIQNNNYKIYSFKDMQPVVEEVEDIAWQQLISVLTHEMMNSLTPIISLSETLSKNDTEYDPETMSKAMSVIHRRSRGLVNFVSNYKKLTQIPSPQKKVLSVKSLVEDIVELFRTQGINIEYILTSENIMINADREQMEQVLINLIKNAWEASMDKPKPQIRVSVMEDSNRQVAISILDNGVGINSDITEKIFMPFYTTKPNGSGIGLSICRQIINMHGGILAVTSIQNDGSTFIIRL
jgi:Signal transduction histidine kinase involved in nitrogen fixation and metabolism regulation